MVSARTVRDPARSAGDRSLAARLRRDTAALHAQVEDVADLPASIVSRADCRDLLQVF